MEWLVRLQSLNITGPLFLGGDNFKGSLAKFASVLWKHQVVLLEGKIALILFWTWQVRTDDLISPFFFFLQQARIWHRHPISWLPTGCYPEPLCCTVVAHYSFLYCRAPDMCLTLVAPGDWAISSGGTFLGAVRCIGQGPDGTKGLNARWEV